jgi:Secretion system C-terminal sorting domain
METLIDISVRINKTQPPSGADSAALQNLATNTDLSIARAAKLLLGNHTPMTIPFGIAPSGNRKAPKPIYYDALVPEQAATITPNPANSYIDVSTYYTNISNAIFEIKDITGKVILQQAIEIKRLSQRINIEHLIPGAYMAIIRNDNKIMFNEKIIIVR